MNKKRLFIHPPVISDETFHVAGNFHWTPEDVAKSIVCMMMSGPFLTGYTQVLYYSRKLLHTSLESFNLVKYLYSSNFHLQFFFSFSFFRQLMIGMTERLMPLMNLIVQYRRGQYLRVRLDFN